MKSLDEVMDRRSFVKFMVSSGTMMLSQPLWLTSCSKVFPPAPRPRLVLLYATCSLNKYCLAPYNEAVTYTPAIARFAAKGAIFARHQTESGKSGISYASIITGNQSDRHGVYAHPRSLQGSLLTITEAFKDNGYDVYFWNNHRMASYDLNYGQGVPKKHAFKAILKAGDDRFKSILTRLSSEKDYRAFIFVNFSVTHSPYTVGLGKEEWDPEMFPDEFKGLGITVDRLKEYRQLYLSQGAGFRLKTDFSRTMDKLGLYAEDLEEFIKVVTYLYKCGVRRLDTLFGEVIDLLSDRGLLDESLVVFTADHGETFCRDNTFFKFSHGFQLAPEVLTVPLIIRAPSLGVTEGRFTPVTRSIDIFPTLMGLCGLRIPKDHEVAGVNLAACVTGKASFPRLPAYSHTSLVHDTVSKLPGYREGNLYRLFPRKDPNLMWVSTRIEDTVFKIAKLDLDSDDFSACAYDLALDPNETKNIFNSANEDHRRILDDLHEYKRRLVSAYLSKHGNAKPGIPEDERIRRLKALGYL